jgi:hypothetical protein
MRNIFLLFLASALLLSACGPNTPESPTPDVNALYTAAAQTVAANLTMTAKAVTPTAEATATEASAPASATLEVTASSQPEIPLGTSTQIICDDAEYISDVTVSDGTEMTPGQDFVKTWHIKNTGSCTWGDGYTLIYGGYNVKMDGQPTPITTAVLPGQEIDVSVQLKAPTKAGEYLSAWRMVNPKGIPFGKFFWVKILVK